MNESDAYFRGAYHNVNSDGWRLHCTDLARVGGYAEALEDMPLPHEIDESNRRAAERLQASVLMGMDGGGL